MKNFIYCCISSLIFLASNLTASLLPPRKNTYHVAPPSWYLGFTNPELEIILHAENIGLYNIALNPFQGVTLDSVIQSANRHVCYLQLNIKPGTQPGFLEFTVTPKEKRSKAQSPFVLKYELKQRRGKEMQATGLTPNDVTYLIFPDRFSNGETDNDNADMQYRVRVDRGGLKSRHGGDLAGVKSKLDYLKELGITALLSLIHI